MEPTTSTTARDDLAKTATSAFYVGGTNLNLMTAVLRLAWFRVADAILAAGYRKPRTIENPDELSRLAEGSIILMKGVKAPFLLTDRGWESTRVPGKPVYDYTGDLDLFPAQVMWEARA